MDLDLSEETVSLQICVNVVPGDEAAGRVPDPKVRTELLFQQAQEAKRQAADAIARGDHDDALQTLAAAGESLAGVDDTERAVLLDVAAEVSTGSAAARRSAAGWITTSRAGSAEGTCESVRTWPAGATHLAWGDTTMNICAGSWPRATGATQSTCVAGGTSS
jgi:hypothetical protein